MALAACKANGGIIPDDMGADLGHRLALGRVDLAGHDRASGFVFGQQQFVQATARTRAQKPDVIGDLEQAGGRGFQRARHGDHCVMGGKCFELVGGCHKRQAGDAGHVGGDVLAPAFGRVEPGANSRTALGQFIDVGKGAFHTFNGFGDLMGIARKFLRQRQRRGVHRVGAADFDDAVEFFGFCFQRGVEFFQARQ